VPDELYFEGRIGVHVGEDVKNVQKQLENSIYRAAEKDPWLRENRPSVEWRGYRFDPASIRLDHPIIESVRTAYRDICKTDPRVEGKTYSSDMRFFCNLGGTPAMIFGPGEVRQAHSVDENIKIENLELASKVIILTIIRYCGM
jgi:acetylornithine deacetylase